MSPLRKISQIIFTPILWPLYLLSGLIPKSQAINVYGSPGNRFSDNAKYAYLKSSTQSHRKSKHYWITSNISLIQKLRSHGLLAEHRWSVKGVIICCRAGKYHFSSYSSDVNFWTSRNSLHINYWHGVPFKKIEHDIYSGPLKTRFNPTNLIEKIHSFFWYLTSPAPKKRPDILYSPHAFFDQYFLSAFRITEKNLRREVYPRVEFLKDNTILPHDIYGAPLPEAILKLTSGKTTVLYAPTFRDSNKKSWIKNNILLHQKSIQRALAKKNIFLLIKPHPNEQIDQGQISKNIFVLSSQIDTYILMKSINHVVTDYSSIAVDAAQAGKNVYLLWPDLEDYKSKSRDLYFDIKEFYKGKYYSSLNSLLRDLESGGLKKNCVTPEINSLH